MEIKEGNDDDYFFINIHFEGIFNFKLHMVYFNRIVFTLTRIL